VRRAVVLLLAVAALAPVRSRADGCPVTPSVDLLAAVGPLAGEAPVWAAVGGAAWCCPDCAVKVLWVVARSRHGDLMVRGERLDGDGVASFRAGGEPVAETLRFEAADANPGVVPGGADRATVESHAFLPSHAFFPAPGCWQMTAGFAGSEVRIVVELEDASAEAWCRSLRDASPDAGPKAVEEGASRAGSTVWSRDGR
jgi:hypothetical protein